MKVQSTILLIAVLGLHWACSPPRAPERAAGSALWVAEGPAEVGAVVQNQLASQGIDEFFFEVGRLTWTGGTPVVEGVEEPAGTTRSSQVTLVIRGDWTIAEVVPSEAIDILGTALERSRLAARDRRLLTTGFHFDVAIPGGAAAESLAEVIGDLRKRFEEPLEFSVRLPLEANAEEKRWRRLIEAVDFFVTPLYGQRPGETDDPDRWDLTGIQSRLAALDGWERPYLGEIVTLGNATLLGPGGAPRETVTVGDVQSLAWNQSLVAGHGNALARGTRQVYEFQAHEATSAAFRRLEPSEGVRVVSTATPILAELLSLLDRATSPYYRGALFYRMPQGGEEFGLGLQQLINAHVGGEATLPDLDLDVEVTPRGGPRWALTLTLTNRTQEPTELSVLDANWVQVQLEGAFVNWVRPGHFPRYQTFQTGSDGELYVALRHADTFRLYVPLVRGEDELVAGPIEIRGWHDGTPRMLIGGAFITPYGGTLELPPEPWREEAEGERGLDGKTGLAEEKGLATEEG